MNETFRPRSNFVWAGVSLLLIALFATNSIFVVEDPFQKAVELALGVLLGLMVLAFWVRPRLVLTEDHIVVVNPLITIRIPYEEVSDLETKWALTIVHKRGKTRVWVAPASGKQRWIADAKFGQFGSSVPLSESRGGTAETMSASLESLSGQAAHLIRERMKRDH